MSQLYLFTGENEFMLSQKLRLWLEEFAKKHGEENIAKIESKKLTIPALLDEVCMAPFIATKRLVVVYGIPSFAKEDIQTLQTSIHPDVLLLFVEAKPDKRLAAVKALLKEANVTECSPLSPQALSVWLDEYATSQGVTLQPAAKEELLTMVGLNQLQLANEIEKFAQFANGKPIQVEDVHTLTISCNEQKVWALLDLVAQQKSSKALAFVERLLLQGENVHGVWNILLWMIGNVAPVYSSVQSGSSNPASIAKESGVPFPTVKTLLPYVKKLSSQRLSMLLQQTMHYEYGLKIGHYKATAEDDRELRSIIDNTILLWST